MSESHDQESELQTVPSEGREEGHFPGKSHMGKVDASYLLTEKFLGGYKGFLLFV